MKFVLLFEDANGDLRVRKEDLHHMRVLRMGTEVELPGLLGSRRFMVRLKRSSREYEPVEIRPEGTIEHGHTSLILPLLETNRIEWCLEKGSELGISEFHFYHSKRTPDHVRDIKRVNAKFERFHLKILSACQQSGNLDIPKISKPRSLEEILDGYSTESDPPEILGLGMSAEEVLDPREDLCSVRTYLIGPEGDFSREEYDGFNRYPFLSMKRLPGSLVLRSETAALYLATWNHWKAGHSSKLPYPN